MGPDVDTLEAHVFESVASTLDPVPVPPSARSRLMAEVTGRARFLPHAVALATHFDLGVEQMKDLLAAIDEPGRWTTGIEPIQGFLHFRPGPRCAELHGGFVRMRRGMAFPMHRHKHREVTYVLDGTLVDDRGNSRGPGGVFEMAAGSAHTLAVTGDDDCLIALLHGGIEMLGA